LAKSLLHYLHIHPQDPITAFKSTSFVSLHHTKHESLFAVDANPKNVFFFMVVRRALFVACRAAGAFTPELEIE
jgi:hypothetical protein